MSEIEIRELSDRELMSAHVAGDSQAFSELVSRHKDRLWSVSLRTTGDPEEAADALQDALISAFRRPISTGGRPRSPRGCTELWSMQD